jgi:hypothetical protein
VSLVPTGAICGTTIASVKAKRREVESALWILFVLDARLVPMGYGSGKAYHHHHWDYHFLPPHP